VGSRRAAVLLGLALVLGGCGVKGPPRPPLREPPPVASPGGSKDGAAGQAPGTAGAKKVGATADGGSQGSGCQDEDCLTDEERARRKAANPGGAARTPSP